MNGMTVGDMTAESSREATARKPEGRCGTELRGRSPGRPRSEQAEKAIIEAVLNMMADGVGLGELSIEAIAAQAGVGKATIYRRWPNKEALVIDAIGSLDDPIPSLPGISVRDDLVTLVAMIRRRRVRGRSERIMSCLIAAKQRCPELSRRYEEAIIEPRREAVRQVLRRGIATGELRPDLDIDLVQRMITYPMLLMTMIESPGQEPPEDLPARMVDLVLEGLVARD
jgi:AcrR family transcriptional regulator